MSPPVIPSRLFVDTSAWFALIDRSDQNHQAARLFLSGLSDRPVQFHLTDYIIDETVTLLRLRLAHRHAVNFLDYLRRSPHVVRANVPPDLLIEAEDLFRRYKDKRWSYTDCVSFVYMDQQTLDDAFSFDSNFAEYGKTLHPDR